MPREGEKASKTPPRAPETNPKRRNHDHSALSTFQSFPNHDLSALPNDYERRNAPEITATSRSTGPVNVSEPQGAQNSSFGRVEAAILDTFIVFEPPGGSLGPLHFDPPGIPAKRHASVLASFLSKTLILHRREFDFRFPRKSSSPKTE